MHCSTHYNRAILSDIIMAVLSLTSMHYYTHQHQNVTVQCLYALAELSLKCKTLVRRNSVQCHAISAERLIIISLCVPQGVTVHSPPE